VSPVTYKSGCKFLYVNIFKDQKVKLPDNRLWSVFSMCRSFSFLVLDRVLLQCCYRISNFRDYLKMMALLF